MNKRIGGTTERFANQFSFPAHLLLAGMAAPLVYSAVVIVGGALTADYSHVDQAISELTATGASRRYQLEPGFVA